MPEVGASPDATYGEALETPNQRRKRLSNGDAAEVPSPTQYPFREALSALQDAPSSTSASTVAGTPPPSAPARSIRTKSPRTHSPVQQSSAKVVKPSEESE